MLDRFTWFKQSAFRYDGDGITVYFDAWGIPDDAPPADVLFVSHGHFDHFDRDDLARIRSDATTIVCPRDLAAELSGNVIAVAPGDDVDVSGIKGQAVPAYNIAADRLDFHPKSNGWVGYVLTLDGFTVYHAGDTDHTSDLSSIRADAALLPIGGHYTMDADEAAGLVHEIRPGTAVPMHYGFLEDTAPASASDRFRAAAEPTEVHVFDPVNPFEHT
ncbi:MAG TPA: MBL fold metallo-hydrolase [Actinomycetota bacterium]|nr:MBL fold metallo-hydrolase [Actinomycetota bacterium]